MADSVKDLLVRSHVLDHVVVTGDIDRLLSALEVTGPTQGHADGSTTGAVSLVSDLSKSPLTGFDFALTLPDPRVSIPFKLKLEPATNPTSFKFWLQLADEHHVLVAFTFIEGVPGLALTGATSSTGADGLVRLAPLPPADPQSRPRLVSRSAEPGAALGPALLVTGTPSAPASIRITPDTDSTDGVVTVGLDPPTVVFGTTAIGFNCSALTIDDSETAVAPQGPGAQGLDPKVTKIAADSPPWRGIVARHLDFYLPADVPLFGGQPISGYLEIPRGPGGVNLVIETTVAARPPRPGYQIRIECLDPAATGLSALVPTLISASMDLPLDGTKATFTEDQGPATGTAREITFGAGKPVQATLTLSRDPVNAPGDFSVVVSVAGQGPAGLLSVTAGSPGGAKIFNTAAALATALIADKDVAKDVKVGDTPGVVLATLLAAGGALSSLFENGSQFTLHGIEIESSGHGAPVGGPLVFTIDYSVAVIVTGITVGELSVQMDPKQPMRIRVRQARMSVDFNKSGLSMIGLDFDRATLEVEDPGAWDVGGLKSLFDVLRSRSGRGSSWIEVDLGFKLNLGPVKVSGATIQATLQDNGQIVASLRGLQAGLDIPGAVSGSGALQLVNPAGFAADLRASIVPLNLSADADVVYTPDMVLLSLSVDLPAPIPLASTGFGLLGIGGLLGFSARPDYAATGETDPVAQQLHWQPAGAQSFRAAPGQSSFGLAAVVGTLPDAGYTLSAKAGILITVPDIAIRGALNGRVLQPPVRMTDPSWPPPPGISFLGFIGADSTALSFGLLGRGELKPLLDISVPVAGHFPLNGGGRDTGDWYTYLGADGAPVQDRGIGPISAVVLPDYLPGIRADAYFMARGHGLTDWPYGRRLLSVTDGFVVAFGFSLQNTFGVKPVLWAELHASLDLLVGSKPPTLAGFGRAGGSLHLGPFSLGVQAQVTFVVTDGDSHFWAEVTGRVELLFFEVEGTVTISFGSDPPTLTTVPPPDRHPLDRVDAGGARTGSLAVLTDDSYQTVAELAEDPAAAKTVWPDTIVSLPFAVAPAINPAVANGQFPGAAGPGAIPPPDRLGTEMLFYNWRLESVTLRDVTQEADKINGAGTGPAGQLAARWQVPRSGPGGSDISELLLFSTGPDLWVNRLADGGASLPGDNPLKAGADICHATLPDPAPGWAIGFLAETDVPGFRLPPETVSANPRVSRVEARLHHAGVIPGQPAGTPGVLLDTTRVPPGPATIDPAALIAWSQPATIGRSFEGHFVAPNLRCLTGLEVPPFLAQQIRLDLAEPMVNGQLIIVADQNLVEQPGPGASTRLTVTDNHGSTWRPGPTAQIPTGEMAFDYPAPTQDAVSSLTVTFPLGAMVGVIGVGGTTVSSRDAVALERSLIQAETGRRAKALSPPLLASTHIPYQRAILDPGRLYRVDVEMTWAGTLSKQNEAGQIEVVDSVDFGGPGSLPTTKHLFFRTAAAETTPPPDQGLAGFLTWLMHLQTAFRPEMLQRYLAGYEPGQAEEFRFCDDPLRAHFLQDHVVALARTYGFEFGIATRRVDRPGPDYATPMTSEPDWSYGTNPAFLGATDQKRFAFAKESGCPGPLPGATGTVAHPELEPEALYEVYVQARAAAPGFADGRLPGVTFRTSRWRDPDSMFAGLGFQVPGHIASAVTAGDLVVRWPGGSVPAAVTDDDQAFETALGALGISGWPPTSEPRLSRLWTAGTGGWLFAGLMIESPEPVHRAGRVEVTGLQAQAGPGNPVTFGFSRRDRIGARLLYLTQSPVLPAAAPVLTLTARSDTDVLTATVSLPQQPSFAGEPS